MFRQPSYHEMMFVALGLTIITPVLGQIAVNISSCFSTGVAASGCSSFIDTFCGSGAVILPVSLSDSFSLCFNAPAGFKCDFTARNALGTATNPAAVNCEDTLSAIVEECPMGGEGSVQPGGSFTFALDPNEGSCGPDVVTEGS
ncbi:hypothetical protein BT96DRAFT_978321 [Gymnopus androsaceus JB14]|uniref:Glycan binding protein Y3-like domain-containing protein n=1 Tax=Gymnopus androsaceus JB14 TaxID=1447944 RepID=A0A6A4HB27_9AGAR|nr:hypothetical protein BT96DRAFT_978321 [Gymnopus androsaceus JB14]